MVGKHISEQTDSNAVQNTSHESEIEAVLKAAGNWWSDIDEICRRLQASDLNRVTQHEERFAMIQEACDAFLQDTEAKLLEELHLDGSVQLPVEPSAGDSSSFQDPSAPPSHTDTTRALSALGTWKCLETLADVTSVTGSSALIGSPQELLNQKGKTPPNCVSPVEALLPFNYREEGEEKFLDLLDQGVLFLRPKVRRADCCCSTLPSCSLLATLEV
jgi:hypothetical protein